MALKVSLKFLKINTLYELFLVCFFRGDALKERDEEKGGRDSTTPPGEGGDRERLEEEEGNENASPHTPSSLTPDPSTIFPPAVHMMPSDANKGGGSSVLDQAMAATLAAIHMPAPLTTNESK